MSQGVRGTGNFGVVRKYDVANVISLLDVERYPMLAILTNVGKDPVTKQGKSLKKKETTDPEFKWFEDKFGAREDSIASNQASAGALVVTNIGHFSMGDVLLCVKSTQNTNNPTGEVMIVTAIDTGTSTLTLVRKIGDAASGGGLLQVNDIVWIIGNANEEGSGVREIKATSIAEASNYTQIFRTPIGITETARNTKGWTESDFDYQTKKKASEHMVDIERAFLFGKKEQITSGLIHPKRFAQGVIPRIAQKKSNVSTRAEFNDYLEVLFKHGNTEKYLFASPYVISKVNEFAMDKLQVMSGEKTFGLVILKYMSPHGTLNLIKHELLAGALYGKTGVGLDMETLTYRYLSNRDTKLLTNRQAPGEDARIDEYLTECGLQFEQPERHAIVEFA